MTKAAALRATYADWRLIKTRSVVQVVLELPIGVSSREIKLKKRLDSYGIALMMIAEGCATPTNMVTAVLNNPTRPTTNKPEEVPATQLTRPTAAEPKVPDAARPHHDSNWNVPV